MYLVRFLNTPLGGGGQHRRLPRAANTLSPPLRPRNAETTGAKLSFLPRNNLPTLSAG